LCYIRPMAETKEKAGVFQVTCPCCGALLWVDGESRAVMRSEKVKKAKGSLDDLLVREKARTDQFGRKFDATFELQREKHVKADELFQKALEKAGKDEDEEGS
jgi:adenine-specific DNA methylase